MLENDWFSLIEFISEKFPHIIQAVTTNGSIAHILKSDNNKKNIFLKCISEVDVSLDYCCANVHNKIRNNDAAFDWAIDTMKFCNENGIKLTVVTIGLNDTLKIDNIKGIFDIAEKYNAYNRINIYRKAIDRDDHQELDYDVLHKFLEWASMNDSIIELSDPLFNSIYGNGENIQDASGVFSYRIVSDGRIYPSTYLLHDDFLLGNITDDNFEFFTANTFIEKVVIPAECQDCRYVETCKGGALDRRYLWFKTFSHPDPYCPRLHKESRQYNIYVKSNKENFESVHDGYLPTLFFKKGKKNE